MVMTGRSATRWWATATAELAWQRKSHQDRVKDLAANGQVCLIAVADPGRHLDVGTCAIASPDPFLHHRSHYRSGMANGKRYTGVPAQ